MRYRANRVVIEVNDGVASVLQCPDDIEIYVLDRDTLDLMEYREIEAHLEDYPPDMRCEVWNHLKELVA